MPGQANICQKLSINIPNMLMGFEKNDTSNVYLSLSDGVIPIERMQ